MEPNFLDKNDLNNLFPGEEWEPEVKVELEPKPKSKPPFSPRQKLILKFVGLFLGIFLLSYLVINFSALEKQIGYFWTVKIRHLSYNQTQATPTPIPTVSFNPTASAKLKIAKIGADAPIIWNVEESQTQDKLLEGVVHTKGTALPGQQGNIFITGHSSYYSWVASPYKDIFALLENVGVNDEISIQYEGATFTYKIDETKVVSPNDLSVLKQGSDRKLTLMTCVPIGTNLRRLIVTALQTSTN